MADEIDRWSEELARDPTSGVFIPLADALRRRGQLDLAARVATRGLARRPYDGDAHDLLARIWADRGDVQRAMDEWSMALHCAPTHPGALKGMGFACYQVGRAADAERYLVEAAAVDPDDASIRAALVRVRQDNGAATPAPEARPAGANGAHSATAPKPEMAAESRIDGLLHGLLTTAPAEAAPSDDPQLVFEDVLEGEQAALVVDRDGLVLAGRYVIADGRDVAPEVGAALSGVSDEAHRAMRHLELGSWTSLLFETDAATVGMAPVLAGEASEPSEPRPPAPAPDGLALLAAGPSVPLGLVRRQLSRVVVRAEEWLRRGDRGSGA